MVGVMERQWTGERVGHGDAENSRGARRGHAVGRVLEGDRGLGDNAKIVERGKIRRWSGLVQTRVFRAASGVEIVSQSQPLQVTAHVIARRARSEADFQP